MKTTFAAILLLLIGAALTACQSAPRPRVDAEPYTGPRVAIESWGLRHQVTVTAPTGGWAIELDQSRDANGRREVFITARRPPRDQMTTQALVPHQIDSRVDSRTPIDIYIRVVDRGGDPADFPYRLAASSDQQR